MLLITAVLTAQKTKTAEGDAFAMTENGQDSIIVLPEFIVTAPYKDIVQMGDTTIINAGAYKTPEGSYLEELVKRIPGLEYDAKNKSLYYNGHPIASINVNGEEFFSGNKAMALENLPVELIRSIKVYDKRSELEKITGIREGGENYVLDIQTKREFNGTLMASGKVGRGNHGKKELELSGNYFKEGGKNLSLVANSGNRNMTSGSKGNIQNSLGFNISGKQGEKLTVNGNVNYSSYRDGSQAAGYTEQYLASGNRYQLFAGQKTMENHDIGSQAGVFWQIDEKTFFNFHGYFSSSRSESSLYNRQATFDDNPGTDLSDPFAHFDELPFEMKINDVGMRSVMHGKSVNYSINANATRKINQKGSSISLVLNGNRNYGNHGNFTNSSTNYFRFRDTYGNDSILHRIQWQNGPSDNRNQNVGLMFTHPFTKELNVQFSYNLVYSIQKSDRDTYDLSTFIDGKTDGINPKQLPEGYENGYIDSLSNRSDSRTIAHDFALRMNFSNDSWDVNAGLSVRPERRSTDQKTGLQQADTVTLFIGFQPSLMTTWKKGKFSLRFNYQANSQQPSLTDLLSLANTSDPLNITRGNPHLKPAFNQYAQLEASDNRHGFSVSLSWRNTLNSITRSVVYNLLTGGSESYPVNINGDWNGNAMMRYQKSIHSFKFAAYAGSSYNHDVSLVNEGESEQPERSVTKSKGLNSNLRVSYLPEWGSFGLTGDWRFRQSYNSLRQTSSCTRNYNITFDHFSNLPGNVRLGSDIHFLFRNGTNIREGDYQFVWNLNVAWLFMKKRQGELSVYWSDILNKQKNYYRNVTADSFYEYYSRQIGSYFIVSFRYKLNIVPK